MTPCAPAKRATYLLLALLAAAALAASCAVPDPDGSGADLVNPATGAAAAPAGEAPGTRQNPVPAGTTVNVGEWQVSLGPTVLDAGAQIAAENQFNAAPAAGRQFVMVPVSVVYNGTESGTPWIALSVKFVGAGGNTFGAGGAEDYCGSIPSPLNSAGEMFPGASASGNVCVSVPSDQVEGGAWSVEETLSLNGDRTFVALR